MARKDRIPKPARSLLSRCRSCGPNQMDDAPCKPIVLGGKCRISDVTRTNRIQSGSAQSLSPKYLPESFQRHVGRRLSHSADTRAWESCLVHVSALGTEPIQAGRGLFPNIDCAGITGDL